MHLPPGLKVHAGFLDAWRSVRQEVMDTLDELQAEERQRTLGSPASQLRLFVSGHSMGGAMAMLAALDLAHYKPSLRPVTTYTFAAPRVGDARFARLFGETFPDAAAHWALQAEADAVPHLPFRSWGFEHPDGVAVLSERPCLERTGDLGDSVACLRPREGKAANWATCHDLNWYMARIRSALGDGAFVAGDLVPA